MKRTLIAGSSAAVATLILPLVAQAQTIQGILNTFGSIISTIVVLFIGVAIIVFFFGLIKYLASAGDKKHEGLLLMMYGIIAIFVMVSIWGLVRVLQNTFGVVDNGAITAPYRY